MKETKKRSGAGSPQPPALGKTWKVFLDVKPPESYGRVPRSLPSPERTPVVPRTVRPKDDFMDLAALAGWWEDGAVAVLFNEFIAKNAGSMKVGFSAEWRMEIHWNGKRTYSTMENGNGSDSFATADHVVELPAKKGKNLLAVKVVSRSGGWKFVCGIPSATPHAVTHAGRVIPAIPVTPAALGIYRAEWAALRPKLDKDIERNRKGDAVLELVDVQGKPLADAELDIQQTSHAFAFGCNILPLGQLGPKNERYEQAFARLFNLATTTFCLSAVQPEPGRFRFAEGSDEIWRRPPPDRVVAFCKKHGIAVKGQPLMAGSWHPGWAPKEPEEIRKVYREWFAKVAERYGRDFRIWDVVNESFCHTKFPLCTPGLEYVGWAFREALRLFPPESVLEINEATPVNGPWRDRYFRQVKGLLDQGVGPRSVGIQFHLFPLRSHMRGNLYPPLELLETYGKLSRLGLPLYITEVTIPAILGEDIQAEALVNLYRLWFSRPRMAGIIYWNLCDGAAWKNEGDARGGLTDADLLEKPAYQALYQLVHREWRTRLATKTDAQGKAVFRGFFGKYAVTADAGGRARTFEFAVSKDVPAVHRIVWE
jgi:endo-1,4-beta-xylanase